MTTLSFVGQRYEALENETVLGCLERHGVTLPSSCRSGVCQSCMLKATAGEIPPASQQGLKSSWKSQGFLLSCVCPAAPGLELLPCDAGVSVDAVIEEVSELTGGVLRVRLRPLGELVFQAGQFVSLMRHDGLVRPYSIASLPEEKAIELHVALVRGGRLSNWLRTASGEQVSLRGPSGDCFYEPGRSEQPLMLAGTGTGLAPLFGIVKAALAGGHSGPIRLYHGSVRREGLYLWQELSRLAQAHSNLSIVGAVLERDGEALPPGVRVQRLEEAVFGDVPKFAGQRVFLCGNAELVRVLRRKAYLAGASLGDIHCDPFIEAKPPA